MKILKTFIFFNIAIFSLSAQETTMLIDAESSSLNWIGKKMERNEKSNANRKKKKEEAKEQERKRKHSNTVE